MTHVVAFLVATLAITGEEAERPGPSVVVSFRRPDLQLARLIDLFRDTRASDPAAALAAWKNATQGNRSLGKAAEAGIAALNLRMVPELKTLDHAALLLDLSSGGVTPNWCLCVPHDDGTLAAISTAAALTDGMSLPDLDQATVDRLGPEGAAMMARTGDQVVVASSRDQLVEGLQWLRDVETRPQTEPKAVQGTESESRTALLINPESLSRSSSSVARQIGQALLKMGWHKPRATITLQDRGLIGHAVWNDRDGDDGPRCELVPEWIKSLPVEAAIAFSVAVDPRPATWDRFFEVLDVVEKADPSRADRASLRTRWNLLATLSRLDPERDLLPNLVGVSGFSLGSFKSVDGLAIGIHTRDVDSASKLRTSFFPSLARGFRLADSGQSPEGWRGLGLVQGQAVLLLEDTGPTVWLAWGAPALEAIGRVRREPSASRMSVLADQNLRGLSRVGWIHLSQGLDGSVPTAVFQALEVAKTVEWTGRSHGAIQWDRLSVSDLHPVVRRFLEVVPQKPLNDPGRD